MTPEELLSKQEGQEPGFFYLAGPYTGADHQTMQDRVDDLRMSQAYLLQKGFFLYPAIGATHEVVVTYSLRRDFEFWEGLNRVFITKSIGMIICTIPGWLNSAGVRHEIALCRELSKPMYLFDFGAPNGPELLSYA